MSLSRHTIKSQVMSIYRKLGTPSRSQAVARSVSSVSWRDDDPVFHPIGAMELAPARRGLVPNGCGGTRSRADA
jgi:hypothetical protein